MRGPFRSADVQKRGPYRRWEHSHALTRSRAGPGSTTRIDYEVPFGPLGDRSPPTGRPSRPGARVPLPIRAIAASSEYRRDRRRRGRWPSPAGPASWAGPSLAELRRRGDRVIVLSHRAEIGPRLAAGRRRDPTRRCRDSSKASSRPSRASMRWSSPSRSGTRRWRPRRGRTFMEVDAGGTEHLADAAARVPGRPPRVHVGRRCAPDATGTGSAPSGGPRRPSVRAGMHLHHHPPDVDLRTARRVTQSVHRVRPVAAYGADDQPRTTAAGARVHGRHRRLVADSLDRATRRSSQVFEIGGPETLPMREIIGRAHGHGRHRRPIVPGPTPLIKLAVWPLKLLPATAADPDAMDFINQPATVDNGPAAGGGCRVD